MYLYTDNKPDNRLHLYFALFSKTESAQSNVLSQSNLKITYLAIN